MNSDLLFCVLRFDFYVFHFALRFVFFGLLGGDKVCSIAVFLFLDVRVLVTERYNDLVCIQ